MSSSELRRTSRNRAKDSSETEYESLHSPRGQLNIESTIQPTERDSGICGKLHKMELEPTTSLSVSLPACKLLPSTHKLDIRKTEDIRNTTTFLSNTNLSPDHSCAKPSHSKLLSPGNKENVSLKPASVSTTKTATGLNISGQSRSKVVIQNPVIKLKTKKDPSNASKASAEKSFELPSELPSTSRNRAKYGSETEYESLHSPRGQLNIETIIQPTERDSGIYGKSHKMELEPTTSPTTSVSMTKTSAGLNISGQSRSKVVIQNPVIKLKTKTGPSNASKASAEKSFELPISRRKIAETFSLTEACKFFLTFIKSRRTDLRYKEGQIDCYTVEIQKAVRDAEQVSFKMEAQNIGIPKELSAAITQSQKLQYLLSISSRSFAKLDHVGSSIWKALPEYCNEAEMYHKSIDRLLEYIVVTMAEKCR